MGKNILIDKLKPNKKNSTILKIYDIAPRK